MSFLEAIQQAGPADLEQIQKRLTELDGEAAALRAAQRILQIKIHGAPQKNGVAFRQSPGGGESARTKIIRYLVHAGRSSTKAISEGTGIEAKNVYNPLNHEWFQKLGNDWDLSASGKSAGASLKNGRTLAAH